ncbi:MAG: heat shock protein HspQ [Planctomycetota bacterium]
MAGLSSPLDREQLPFLLALFDDESRLVQDGALQALDGFGDDLTPALDAMAPGPDPAQRRQLESALADYGQRTAAFAAAGDTGPLVGVALLAPGDVVRHRRYGYRGVVAAADLSCRASDAWYERNQTHPERSQPWYHILVDGSQAVTYAAQTSLQPDDSGEPIEHTLLSQFFDGFIEGRYERNGLPWPEVER